MKKHLLIITLLLISAITYAIPAKKGPIKITQPDGSTIMIEVHGDEFLGWTTASGRLVQMGSDGFYYNASFNAAGEIELSSTRAKSHGLSLSSEAVSIPAIAVANANKLREERERLYTENRRQGSPSNNIAQGKKVFLTILVEFSDLEFSTPSENFTNLLNEPGYSKNGATGSAYDYYQDNSNGSFDPTYVVAGPYKASKSFKYYGEQIGDSNDANARELFSEILQLADADIDFSLYDQDNDGVLDNLFFFYAGYNQAEGGSPDSIWPHKWEIGGSLMLDGKRAKGYACSSEFRGAQGGVMCGIGTFTHEFGHVIGLPDFYDVDYSNNGLAAGLGSFCLMSGGGYNNDGNTPPYLSSIEKDMLDWGPGIEELTETGNYTLEPVQNDKAYMTMTSNPGEYFVYESRSGEGWDKYIPSGMLIYHVDKSENLVAGLTAGERWEKWLGINAFADHQCLDLIESCGTEKYIDDNPDKVPFPGSDNVTSYTFTTSPSFKAWNGEPTGFGIKNIKDNKTQGVSFSLEVNDYKPRPFIGLVSDENSMPIEDALAIIRYNDKVSEVYTDEEGKFYSELILEAEVQLEVKRTGYETYKTLFRASEENLNMEITLEHSLFQEYSFNFIKLPKASFTPEDILMLELGACKEEPESVTWKVNNSAVSASEPIYLRTGFYLLTAILKYPDREEILTQRIIVE